MRGEWEKANVKRSELVDYAEDGRGIFEEFPDTIDVVTYFDNDGVFLGRTFDEPLWYLINDDTERKLSAIAQSAGASLSASDKWALCYQIHYAFYSSEEQFWTHSAIRNQDALQLLINAYEALEPLDRVALTEAFLHKAECRLPCLRNWQDDVFLEVAKKLIGRGEDGNPPTYEGALTNLRDKMKQLFSSLGLDPEGKHQVHFSEWMDVLLIDPDLKKAEQEWRIAEKRAEAILKEKMPDTSRGKKIVRSAGQGGDTRAKQIREEHGGSTLEERRVDLEKRLKAYRDQGHSHKQACEFLAKQKDVFWAAEYLRKKLKSQSRTDKG